MAQITSISHPSKGYSFWKVLGIIVGAGLLAWLFIYLYNKYSTANKKSGSRVSNTTDMNQESTDQVAPEEITVNDFIETIKQKGVATEDNQAVVS